MLIDGFRSSFYFSSIVCCDCPHARTHTFLCDGNVKKIWTLQWHLWDNLSGDSQASNGRTGLQDTDHEEPRHRQVTRSTRPQKPMRFSLNFGWITNSRAMTNTCVTSLLICLLYLSICLIICICNYIMYIFLGNEYSQSHHQIINL